MEIQKTENTVKTPCTSNLEAYTIHGPIGEEGYARYAPEAPNDPEFATKLIIEKFSDLQSEASHDRREMWKNYEAVTEHISSHREGPVVEEVYDFVRNVSDFAAGELGSERKGLGIHLKATTEFCEKFFLTELGTSRFPELLDDRQAKLMAYVAAPTHDVLKYLGSFKSQVFPDHQVMIGELIRNTFTGKPVNLGGEISTLTAEDILFLSPLVGSNENIFIELERSDWINSVDRIKVSRAMFFVADTLGNAVARADEAGSKWNLNHELLDLRFGDLVFRHVDSVHDGSGKAVAGRGKIFRPEWALNTVEDLGNTLDTLTHDHGLNLQTEGRTVKQILTDMALKRIEEALAEDDKRGERSEPQFTPQQKDRILKTIEDLSL